MRVLVFKLAKPRTNASVKYEDFVTKRRAIIRSCLPGDVAQSGMPFSELPDADDIESPTDFPKDSEVRHNGRNAGFPPQRLEETVHGPANKCQFAEGLEGRRHEASGEPGSADCTCAQNQERSRALSLLPRLRKSGQEHTKRRPRDRSRDDDEQKIQLKRYLLQRMWIRKTRKERSLSITPDSLSSKSDDEDAVTVNRRNLIAHPPTLLVAQGLLSSYPTSPWITAFRSHSWCRNRTSSTDPLTYP